MRSELVVSLFLCACGAAAPPVEAPPPGPRIALRLVRAPAAQAIASLEGAGVVFRWEDPAHALADCVLVDVDTQGEVPLSEAAFAVARAIEPSELVMAQTQAGFALRRRVDHPLSPGCTGQLDLGDGFAPTTLDTEAGIVASIRRLSEHEVSITPATLDAILERLPELGRDVTIAPDPGGLRITGIRAGSTLAALGFEDGDVVRTVGGLRVDSPERALEAYVRLRSQRGPIPIAIDRGGRHFDLVIRVE